LARVKANVLEKAAMQFAKQPEVEFSVRKCAFVYVRRDTDETLGQCALLFFRVDSVIIPQDELLT
jgi:hypothetical protein